MEKNLNVKTKQRLKKHACNIWLNKDYLIKDVFIEIRHIALAGDRPIIVISEMFFKCYWVMWDM